MPRPEQTWIGWSAWRASCWRRRSVCSLWWTGTVSSFWPPSAYPTGWRRAVKPAWTTRSASYAVAPGRPLIVGDARADPVLTANLAVSEMGVSAYAGIPLTGSDGPAFGTLCVIDFTVRDWDDHQLAILARLADIATDICLNERPWSETKGAPGVASTSP